MYNTTDNLSKMNNIKPRTRFEREAMKDKESIEKTRINQRFGNEMKNIDAKQLIHFTDQKSTSFCPENERFDKDFAIYYKKVREEQNERKKNNLEIRRYEKLDRETRKWDSIDTELQKRENKRQIQAEVLQKGKRNTNGMPYNPITLEYEKTEDGKKLKKRDEQAQVRAFVRASNLDQRANTNYNIISGIERKGIEVPNKYQNEYQQKLKVSQDFYNLKPTRYTGFPEKTTENMLIPTQTQQPFVQSQSQNNNQARSQLSSQQQNLNNQLPPRSQLQSQQQQQQQKQIQNNIF